MLPKGPLRFLQGILSAYLAYPIAEKLEKRFIRQKRTELRKFYVHVPEIRRELSKQKLISTLEFAGSCVPYYKDLFRGIGFNPSNLQKDIRFLEEIPFLTKEIIREQGSRLLSCDPADIRHHLVKTGGSTGPSCHLYYDQDAADYAAAVVLYTRERIGKSKHKFETHFACRFPDAPKSLAWTREAWKCFAMNRTNIFFGKLSDPFLEDIWGQLKHETPFLVHSHPSTMVAIADYVGRTYGSAKLFDVFESSGETLTQKARAMIRENLKCSVVNRYGLAEFGIIAYELSGQDEKLEVLESEGWAEAVSLDAGSKNDEELVVTGYRNHLMPLIRYRTGDLASIDRNSSGTFLKNVLGRIHDIVEIGGVRYPTHHIQDILDHRVRGVQQFQFDTRSLVPLLKLVLEDGVSAQEKVDHLKSIWNDAIDVQIVSLKHLESVGRHAKFRYVVGND